MLTKIFFLQFFSVLRHNAVLLKPTLIKVEENNDNAGLVDISTGLFKLRKPLPILVTLRGLIKKTFFFFYKKNPNTVVHDN